MSFDVASMVTDKIIAMLEKGVIPWDKPWVGGKQIAYNRVSGVVGRGDKKEARPYRGINCFLLDKPGEWATAKQWQDEGCAVKRDERASIVIFYKWVDKKDDKGELMFDEKGRQIQVPFMQYSQVFHISQVQYCDFEEVVRTAKDGHEYIAKIPKNRKDEPVKPVLPPPDNKYPNVAECIESAQNIIDNYTNREDIKLQIVEQNEAYYSPSKDAIMLPTMAQFESSEEFYGTAFHECVHSTGHHTRLNRLDKKANFGNEEYSKEELVAEIGSAMLMHELGLENEHTERNNAAYCQSWLNVLKGDRHMIVNAASKADKAVDFIKNGKEGSNENV